MCAELVTETYSVVPSYLYMDDKIICSLDSNPPPEVITSDNIEYNVKQSQNLSRSEKKAKKYGKQEITTSDSSRIMKNWSGRYVTREGSDLVYVYPQKYVMSRRSVSESSDVLPEVLPFPIGKSAFAECLICFEWTDLNKRLCCNYAVCDDCIEAYCAIQVQQRMVKV